MSPRDSKSENFRLSTSDLKSFPLDYLLPALDEQGVLVVITAKKFLVLLQLPPPMCFNEKLAL